MKNNSLDQELLIKHAYIIANENDNNTLATLSFIGSLFMFISLQTIRPGTPDDEIIEALKDMCEQLGDSMVEHYKDNKDQIHLMNAERKDDK